MDMTYRRVGNAWHFADGTILPVVRGGSDISAGGDTPAGDAGAGDSGTSGDTGSGLSQTGLQAAAGAPAAPAADPFDDAKVEQFGRDYVKKLRDEAAKHRTDLSPYKESLGGFSDGDRQLWLGLSKELSAALSGNDAAARAAVAEKLMQVVTGLKGGEAPAPPAADKPGEQPLTRAELEKWYADQRKAEESKNEVERERTKIVETLKGFGYEEGGPEYRQAIHIAMTEGVTLEQARDKVEAWKQSIIDSAMSAKAGRRGPRPATASGTTASEAKVPKTFADAEAALEARLKANGFGR